MAPVYHNDVVQRPGYLRVWEKHRHTHIHWLVECFAEAVRTVDKPGIPHLNLFV